MDLPGLPASDLDSCCFFKEWPARVELFLALSGRANGNTVAKSGSSRKLCAEVARPTVTGEMSGGQPHHNDEDERAEPLGWTQISERRSLLSRRETVRL